MKLLYHTSLPFVTGNGGNRSARRKVLSQNFVVTQSIHINPNHFAAFKKDGNVEIKLH